MSAKTKGSGLGARMAAAPAVSAVAAGFAAATDSAPEAPAETAPAPKGEVVALNIRLPKALHRTLRERAFRDEKSINGILIEAAEEWLAKQR